MELVFFFVAMAATTIGGMSGMGGGIIIKPVMDAVSGLEGGIIHFMSGCTVLAMAVVSVYRGRKEEVDINYPISTALALGGCIGGVVGNMLFDSIDGNVVLLQSVLLFALNVGIYGYIKNKSKIKTKTVTGLGQCGLIGGGLGGISSFLGIGGGPINIAVLGYFFSSNQKVTARRSIFIILFAQISSFTTTVWTGLPEGLEVLPLFLMMVGGCMGAVIGGGISKRLTEEQMEQFFQDVLVGILCLNAFNVGRLL